MRLLDNQLILSPSDLTGFIACEHLTQLELQAARKEVDRPTRDDPDLEILFARGKQHEDDHLAKLRGRGLEVVEIEVDGSSVAGLDEAARETLAAMRAGAAVIYQATFFHDGWQGHADFLMRVEKPSDLGLWSYEVADTKLARKAKVPAIMQLCAYSEHVTRLQGLEPELIHLELGTGETESLRLRDFYGYYRLVKDRYTATVTGVVPPSLPAALLPIGLRPGALPGELPTTYPEPVQHCGSCRWLEVCTEVRLADDHLSLVAGMRGDWSRRLRGAGIDTVTGLAASAPDIEIEGMQPHIVDRLQNQARLQVEFRSTATHRAEVLVPEAGLGLALLPEPSPGDLFFDMEGDPFAGVDGAGLEYLWGVLEPGAAEGGTWHPFWAHDAIQERKAFEDTVDLIVARLERDPSLHVYHYADYEKNRLRTMAGRYGTREAEVDALLRGEVLVDLLRVVRNGIRATTDGYGLKKLEAIYMTTERGAAIQEAGSSIVAYERWLDGGDQRELDDIEAYNREDCVSTAKLREWLEGLRVQAMREFDVVIDRPVAKESEPSEPVLRADEETARLVALLEAGLPEDGRTEQQQSKWLLAQLLGWHRREARSQWWAYYERRKKSPDELIDDRESIGGLEYVGVVDEVAQSLVHQYRFPPQENKIRAGADVEDPSTAASPGTLTEIDNVTGLLCLKRSRNSDKPHPRALVPGRPIPTDEQRASLARMAETVVAAGDLDHATGHRAGLALLRRQLPAGEGLTPGEVLRRPGEAQLEAAIRLGLDLRGSVLPIQGPPGSGKTWTAARMIVSLTDAGKRVGITATSHKVISNVLEGIIDHCRRDGRPVPRLLQRARAADKSAREEVLRAADNDTVHAMLAAGEVDVVAGTSWLFSPADMLRALDVLFVDEAGQMSLADVLAVSAAARNLVLLGDPQQLAQPSQGTHPPGAGVSSLAHVLGDHPTVSPERGLFLETTFRMHPDLCEFISQVAYEGRLHAEPDCARQRVIAEGPLSGAGLRYLPVDHQGNRTTAPEEVEVVDREFRALLKGRWIGMDGVERDITIDDILVVAPYNAHVSRLTEALPAGARIGTVDKFQGQEAAVVFYSMASSSPVDMPRNLEFLYSLNRLNVAMSRARCLAVLVSSPALLGLTARRVNQVRLANALVTAAIGDLGRRPASTEPVAPRR